MDEIENEPGRYAACIRCGDELPRAKMCKTKKGLICPECDDELNGGDDEE